MLHGVEIQLIVILASFRVVTSTPTSNPVANVIFNGTTLTRFYNNGIVPKFQGNAYITEQSWNIHFSVPHKAWTDSAKLITDALKTISAEIQIKLKADTSTAKVSLIARITSTNRLVDTLMTEIHRKVQTAAGIRSPIFQHLLQHYEVKEPMSPITSAILTPGKIGRAHV